MTLGPELQKTAKSAEIAENMGLVLEHSLCNGFQIERGRLSGPVPNNVLALLTLQVCEAIEEFVKEGYAQLAIGDVFRLEVRLDKHDKRG